MTSGVEMTKTKVVDMVKKYNIIVDNFSIEISYV
jgi:flagellar capping protein FliD